MTKTKRSAATIGVDRSVITRIQRLKTLEVELNWGGKSAKKKIKLVRSEGPQDLVFQSVRKGRPMLDGNILRRHLRPAAVKLGIDPKKATWRALRTSCATWMIEAERRARANATLEDLNDDGSTRSTFPGLSGEQSGR